MSRTEVSPERALLRELAGTASRLYRPARHSSFRWLSGSGSWRRLDRRHYMERALPDGTLTVEFCPEHDAVLRRDGPGTRTAERHHEQYRRGPARAVGAPLELPSRGSFPRLLHGWPARLRDQCSASTVRCL